MSGEHSGLTEAADAATIEAMAADWFGRRQFWIWSEVDQIQLNEWLSESLAHQVAYWRLMAAWERTERLNAIATPMRIRPVQEHAKRKWPKISSMAVGTTAVLAAAIVGAQHTSLLAPKAEVFSTAVGEMKTVTLVDGSSIDLNTDTIVNVSMQGDGRTVSLERGEAYFQIKHDDIHPFTVIARNHRVTDLGTKFLVRDDKTSVRVSLIEGKAQLESLGQPNAHVIVLTPGDVAVASQNSLSISRKPSDALSERLGWREGVLILDNSNLGEAAAEFNRYNKVKLVITDPSVASIPIAGKFPTTGVDRFADLIEHVFGLRVQDTGTTKVISREQH